MAHYNSKWTKATIQDEASKFKTKVAFQSGCKAAYLAAYRRGLIEEVTAHMMPLRKSKWNIPEAVAEASKFETLTEFHTKASGAYNFLRKEGVDIRELISPVDTAKWVMATITEEAAKYCTRTEFKQGNISAYSAAHRLGCIESVCSHMDLPQRPHTYAEIAAEALKYTTKTSFKRGHYGMYQAACRKGIINDVGAHMELDLSSFNPMKPAILYYFKIKDVWKIGITNYTLQDRYYKRDRDQMTDITVWEFELGATTYAHEQTIIELNKEFKYVGDTPFTDGTGITECFTCNIYAL
jgi:hypothetical protein